MIPVSDYQSDSRIVRRRMVYALGLVGVLLFVLVARLAWVQIFQHQRFSTLARDNSIFFTPLPPVRGLIYDRNGELLAQNQNAYSLEILPEKVSDMQKLIAELGKLVTLSEDDISKFRTALKRRPAFEWQTLRPHLREDEAARVAIRQHLHKGVELRARLQRNYPHGELTAHVVGYVGRINADDKKRINKESYRGLRYIGRSGLEEQYEELLRGEPGVAQVETNAHGRIVRSLSQTAPESGKSVHLSLDIELQRKSAEAMKEYEGAVVALIPDSGEVLAFVGAPSFDPNPFVNGISHAAYEVLRNSPEKPLLNRALYGRYAPGSTVKSFMVLVGMQNGIDVEREVNCPGWFQLPQRDHLYRDWKREGHGDVGAHQGLVQSCDVYFYHLANDVGIENIHSGMLQFGFGASTGIDLSGEPSGLIPSPEWKRRVRGVVWYPGETVITGIGQGYTLVTPLQLAAATATLANRGKRVTPRFLRAIESPQTEARQLLTSLPVAQVDLPNIGDEEYEYVIQSMRDVVHGENGTARHISRRIRYEMAGKTGTAQVKSIPQDEEYDAETVEKRFTDHSLFIAFAPIDDPKIAIAVIAEHSGSGSATAAPIARRLMDFYLLERLGMFK